MNGKYRAMHRARLAGALALTGCLIPLSVSADDGNLTQQLLVQQRMSRFQLMLEQVQASVRRRAAARQRAPATPAGPSTPTDLGDWTESVRLRPVTVTDRVALAVAPETLRRLRAEQVYERDQQRILDHRQQRRALIIGARTGGPLGVDFATKRRELVRYSVQSQQQSLQRKLRR
jgi:hypothetical protein